MPDSECSNIVRKALLGFANGTLVTQRDVARFLERNGCKSKWSQCGTYSRQAIRAFLRNELYAGWCVCRKWDLRFRGVHEPLMSQADHRRILKRLEMTAKLHPPLKNSKAIPREFSLRGFIHCQAHNCQITASFAQGRSKKYPYYRCLSRGCIHLRAKRVNRLFAAKPAEAVPTTRAFCLFEADLIECFRDRQKLSRIQEKKRGQRLQEIEGETATFVQAIGKETSPAVQQLYENQLESLQQEYKQLEQRTADDESETVLEPVLERERELLKNPLLYWERGNLCQRHQAQRLVFKAPNSFTCESAYRTAGVSLLYGLMGRSEKVGASMVDLLTAEVNPVAEELRRWAMILNEGSGDSE
ncbi:MAG: recombinase family protein [Deltaproteobacteria bacterium]|nr:recombinase family protein [Deltaproteobacteria bacterium]